LSQLIKETYLEDENGSSLKDLAAKRFIDMLFLNGNSHVKLEQKNKLNFSEISVTLNSLQSPNLTPIKHSTVSVV